MPREYERRIYVTGFTTIGGPVVLADDFEGAFNWTISGYPTGTDFEGGYATDLSFSGNACMVLKTRATNPSEGDWVSAQRYINIGATRKILLDCRFRFDLFVSLYEGIYFTIFYIAPNENELYEARLKYSPSDGKWYYYSQIGTFTEISNSVQLRHDAWHRVRASFDLKNYKYMQLQVDSVVYDLSDYSIPYSTTTWAGEYATVGFMVINSASSQVKAYFDDVLVLEM